MIGVIANPSERAVVSEFFELFKTPWEFYRSDRRYEVLLCSGDDKVDRTTAKAVLFYAGRKTHFDEERKTQVDSRSTNGRILSYKGRRIPIYGDSITFPEKPSGVLTDANSQQAVTYLDESRGTVLARIGYDLFGEVRALLTMGQPPANANLPTFELHIAFLRDLIIGCGVSLVEIPPLPDGHQFIACLTHDVDHASIRRHRWDHTMFGFLYRAILGSLVDVFRGRASIRTLLTNWAAALLLPLTYLGLAKDFWCEFDRYIELEHGLASTFFVIPFKEDPGRTAKGPAPRFRASRYEASDIASQIQRLMSAGCEVGLHGIDAWLDSSKGREELEQIRRITGMPDIGVRMHWLYFDERSPSILEKAGAAYDSTVGYNETVGYRTGTTQAYRPLEATRLLELPMHVMDTALFYPSRLNLSPSEARKRVSSIIDNAVQFGGSFTVNWHDRSIAPERLWGQFFMDLIEELKNHGVWFATAAQAVAWFQARRSAIFQTVSWEAGALRAHITFDGGKNLPGLRLRIHKAQGSRQFSESSLAAPNSHLDIPLNSSIDTRIPL